VSRRGKGRSRWALAVLVGCVALLVLVPAAFAANTAKIKGTVTEAGSFVPVNNIEVTVYEASGKEVPVGFASTEANGAYTVEGLPAGEYKVEFSGAFEGLNYITQYYKGASSFAAAEPVKVAEAETKENISAQMQAGGEVEGTVTDASTHKPLAKAFIVALGPGETVEGAAFTEASGHYTIVGLPTGTYEIGFADVGYVVQYYNDQSSLASANPLPVVQKATAPGINAALMPKIPINTLAPVASGTPEVGQTLSCTSGSWTGTPTPTFAFSWLRDGVPIASANASTYVVQSADDGNGLTCKVTATNKTGSVAAVSNTLTVPVPPPPPPPPPVLTVSSSQVAVSGGAARVPIACANGTCAGTIELTEQVMVRHRHGTRTTSQKKTLVLGKASYALAAGQHTTIAVRLTAAGRNALAKAKHHQLRVRISAAVISGASVSKPVLLSQAPSSKRKSKHK
jgi:Carboxypeptidase regulatory-like domain